MAQGVPRTPCAFFVGNGGVMAENNASGEPEVRGEPEVSGEPEVRRGLRGVRGAVQVDRDDAEAILTGAEELLRALVEANGIMEEDVASVFFSTTADLTAAYPAQAARRLGWRQVALFGMQEQSIQGAMPRVIRVLIHWHTTKKLADIEHVYLGETSALRPDLVMIKKEVRT